MSDVTKTVTYVFEGVSKDLSASVDDASRALKRVESASASAAKATTKSTKSMSMDHAALKRGAAAALGDQVNKLDDLASAMLALGPVAGTAAIALGGVALAATAGATAAVAGVAAIVSLVSAADDLIESTKHLQGIDGLGIEQADIDGIHEANDALQAMTDSASLLGVTIASEFAEPVQRGAILVVASMLAAKDAFDVATDGTSQLSREINSLISFALDPAGESARSLIKTLIGLAELTGATVPDGLRESVEAASTLRRELATVASATAGLEGAAGGYLDRARELVDIEGDHRRAVSGTTEAVNAATAATAARVAESQREMDALSAIIGVHRELTAETLSDEEKIIAAAQDRVSELEAAGKASTLAHEQAAVVIAEVWAAAYAKIEDLQIRQLEETTIPVLGQQVAENRAALDEMAADEAAAREAGADAYWADVESKRQGNAAVVASAAQAFAQLATLYADDKQRKIDALDEVLSASETHIEELQSLLEDGAASMSKLDRTRIEEQIALELDAAAEIKSAKKKAIKEQFVAQQASALVSIVVDTAVAAMRAFADLGPVAGAIAGGIISAAGTVAAITVAAQKAPTFHDGGMIGDTTSGAAPDERMVSAQAGEFVANSRLASSNREALEEGNRTGRMPGGGVTVQIGNRALTDYVLQEARSGALRPLFADPAPSAVGAWR